MSIRDRFKSNREHFGLPLSPAGSSLLECREVMAGYADFLLGPVEFKVSRGEILCLVGPNGAGKTTLLRCIVGLLTPAAGEIRIRGLPMKGRNPEALREVGWVPDDLDEVLPELTARELWDLHALAHSRIRGHFTEMRARAHSISAQLDFRPTNQLIASLSHGMRKKIQLVAGLLHEPSVVVLDEPRNGLDPIAIDRLDQLMRILRDEGHVILVATHDLFYAERTADRVCVLAEGRVAALGVPHTLLQSGELTLRDAFFRLVEEVED